jgi:hypothetical protein
LLQPGRRRGFYSFYNGFEARKLNALRPRCRLVAALLAAAMRECVLGDTALGNRNYKCPFSRIEFVTLRLPRTIRFVDCVKD